MTKLKIKESIQEEEYHKLKHVLPGLIMVLLAWLILNFFLRVSYLVKLVASIFLILLVLYLGFEWYRAYYR